MEWRIWPGEWYLDAGVLLLAFALDLCFRELPSNIHPVVWIGKLVSLLEEVGTGLTGRVQAFGWGVLMAVIVPMTSGGLAWLTANVLREIGPIPYVIGGGLLLSTTFAVRGLARAANDVREALVKDDMSEARTGLGSLVSRDPSELTPSLVAASAIESVAENTTDSYIGPWMAFVVFGIPGAFAYRAVNTLDSMIGHHGKYEYLGKASARLDDALNLAPARLSASLIIVAGALQGLPVSRGSYWAWRGRTLTASPNAGWTMGAMSGLLGVALEKPGYYLIGDGLGDPRAEDIGTTVRIAYSVAVMGVGLALGALALHGLVGG